MNYQLNALVAEKVMGEQVKWCRYPDVDNDVPFEAPCNSVECGKDDPGAYPNCDDYSGDLNSANKVLEKIRDNYYRKARFAIVDTWLDGKRYRIGWQEYKDWSGDWDFSLYIGYTESDSIAEGICLVALMGVK